MGHGLQAGFLLYFANFFFGKILELSKIVFEEKNNSYVPQKYCQKYSALKGLRI